MKSNQMFMHGASPKRPGKRLLHNVIILYPTEIYLDKGFFEFGFILVFSISKWLSLESLGVFSCHDAVGAL